MNRLHNVTTRMGPDLRDAIEALPGLGGIALWVRFFDTDDPALIANTDGVAVEAGPRYVQYSEPERRFILLHELLHVALAHPARAQAMKKRVQDFDEYLYNVACDAIINASLDGLRNIRTPEGAVTLEQLLTPLGQWQKDDRPGEIVRRWSSEALYYALAQQRERIDLNSLCASTGFKSDDLLASAILPAASGDQTEANASIEETLRTWSARLKMARGSLASIFTRLVNELPQVRTPWERILRDLLFRHAQRKRSLDPARPSRRWLALEGELKQREGIDLPFECAKRAARTGRIALAVDTSGSISKALLTRFTAEVAAVLEQTEPLLRFIVCDAAVQQVYDFNGKEGAKLLRNFSFKGGGGTDFRPAITEAAKWTPDLLIYLTDLEGEAGDKPRFPVLWAVPEGKAHAPWGRVIELN